MSEPVRPLRRPVLCFALAGIVVLLGLASREYPGVLPAFLGKYPGDALWALVVFFLTAGILRGWSTLRTAVVALAIANVVEFGQLYHAPWIDAVRDTTFGRLVLGAHFDPLDLAAYALGVLVGVVVDRMCPRVTGTP